MNAWTYTIGDVLRIERKGEQVLARIARFTDSLDDRTPLYVNLRTSDGLYWKHSVVKIMKEQVIEVLPDWQKRWNEKQEAEQRARIDAYLARMTPAEKAQMHREAVRLGIVQERRSPLDIMIDRACGLDEKG